MVLNGSSLCREFAAGRFRWLTLPLALATFFAGGWAGSLRGQSIYYPPYTFTTFAGSAGQSGSANATGSAARFNSPLAVTADASGNVYVADSGNYTIRKISSSGVVSTLAGTAGMQGTNDGTGAAARFVAPTAITVDPHENVFVVDGGYGGGSSLREISPAGVVTTVGSSFFIGRNGNGTYTYDTFNAIAADAGGNIFVADSTGVIVEFVPPPSGSQPGTQGTETTFASASASALAVDANDDVYFVQNNMILMATTGGTITPIAGSGTAGSTDYYPFGGGGAQPFESEFNNPVGLALDSAGNIYVADKGNQTIRKITPTGDVTTMAGLTATTGSADGNGSTARFHGPSGIAVDGSGNIFVADTGNDTIRVSTAATLAFSTWVGTAGVTGSDNGTGAAAQFNDPTGIAVDSNGNAYVIDSGNYTIRKITPDGVVSTFAGTPGVQGTTDGTGSAASFYNPIGITIDSNNNLYVTDGFSGTFGFTPTIREITPAGVVTSHNLEPGTNAYDYAGEAGYFSGIAVDLGGNFYVTDAENNDVDEFNPQTFPPSPEPGYTTELGFLLAGLPYQYSNNGFGSTRPSYSDGTGTAATFYEPHGIAVDANDNLYVSDYGNNTIREIIPSSEVTSPTGSGGVVSTLAGTAGVAGSSDSIGTEAQFNGPGGIAVDSSSNLYVTDRGNDTIRKISSVTGAVSTLAGLATVAGSVDGTGSAARFNSPSGIAVDANGTIYVVDTGNNTIRKSVVPTAPVAVVGQATNILLTSVQLNGTVDANYASTTVEFQYGTDSSFAYNDTTTVLATPGTVTGGNERAVSTTIALSGAQFQPTYYFRVVAISAAGLTTSATASFQPTATPASATLGTETFLSPASVQVTGTYNAEGSTPLLYFDVSTDPLFLLNLNSVSATPATANAAGSTSVTATIDNLAQGTLYYYRLRGSGGTNPAQSPVGTIQTQVLSGLTQQFPYYSAPSPSTKVYAPLPALASLQINLLPSTGGTGYTPGWRLVGEQLWHASGAVITGLTSGDYQVEYRPTSGYIQPAAEQVSLTSGTSSVNPMTLTRYYYPTPTQSNYNLEINLYPTNVGASGGWRLYDPTGTVPWNPSGYKLTGLGAGTYLVECEPVTGQITPPISSIVVPSMSTVNGVTTVDTTTVGDISYVPTTTPSGAAPAPLSFATITSTSTQGQTMPYAYVGQIRSDVGLSSGFVVAQYVVATAAHVVFDDGTLAQGTLGYATNLQWIFERDAGTYDPVPQTPRGALVLSSYSADRIADGTPGVSSVASQNQDVAALYFSSYAGGAGGGYSGFLASDTTPNEFLTSTSPKILVGYPVDTEPTNEQGEMFATPPVDDAFTELSDTTGNLLQVYSTDALYSFGGNSGGPLCVQAANGNYYPAAIYLGESAQTNVRAIDTAVINLFTAAEDDGENNANQTGGGTVIVNSTVTGNPFGVVSIQINMPDAPAGAGWSLGPIGSGYPVFSGGFNLTSQLTGVYNVYYVPVPYYLTPATYNTQQYTTLSGSYTFQGIYEGISGQPTNATAEAGTSATFTVTTTGTPTAYQWQYVNGNNPPVNVTTGTGGTTNTYTISGLTAANAGNYQVLVTWGTDGSVTSAPATLTVSPPSIYTFSQWTGLYQSLTNATPTAAPEKDGVSNLMKYVFDIDPTRPMSTNDIAALPVVGMMTQSNPPYLTLTFREYKYLDPSVTVTVQTTNDLASGTWSTLPQADIVNTGTTSTGDPPPGQTAASDPIMQARVPLTNPGAQFIRLNITP